MISLKAEDTDTTGKPPNPAEQGAPGIDRVWGHTPGSDGNTIGQNTGR